MAKNTQGWQTPTGKQALDALKDAKPMSQVYQENFAKAVADKTKELLKQNQKSAEHPSTQVKQATSAATQEPKTTKQKYEESKKNLSDYTKSDDYRARQQERNREALKKAQEEMFSTGGTSEAPRSMVFAGQVDDKEEELKALVNHYKQQMDAEENQRVRDNDMAEINAMPDEEREELRQYIENRDKNNEVTGRNNLIISLVRGINLDKSKNALTEKYGAEKVDQLASTYSRYLKEEQAKQVEADTRAAVQENPWAQQIPGAVNRLLGGQQAAADRFAEMFSRDDRYSTLAPYVAGDLISLQGNTVTGETANIISGDQYDENGKMIHDGGILRQGAAYLYQGGMSMVDSFARAAAGGGSGGAAALAACNAFSQTVSDASRQGATPEQAYKLGTAVAGVEYLSEKIPMDRVFKLAKGGKTNVLMQAFKQAGIEITTEELSLVGSMAAEAAILREKSSY